MYHVDQEGGNMQVMAKSKSEKPAKTERPKSLVMTVKVDGDLLAAFFDFMESHRVHPAKSDVLTLALQELLKAEGFYPTAGN